MLNNLKIIDLTFSYHKSASPVFSNLNYEFNSGDIVGLYGRNGSGKTTLLNCLSSYYKPTKGGIIINGEKIDKDRKDIAIISAHVDLFEYLDIVDNIKFFLEFYQQTYNKIEISDLLEKYKLTDYKNRYVFEASKGMLKKTQIIIALLLKPKLLLGDEPIDGLDEESQLTFFDDIKMFSNQYGTIVIYSLHDLRLLKKTTNKIIFLNDSKSNSQPDSAEFATLSNHLEF